LYPDFVGTYTHPKEGISIEVTYTKGKLFIREEGDPVELVPVGENRFEAVGFPSPAGFKRDEKGKVKWLIEYYIEEVLWVKQENQKAKNKIKILKKPTTVDSVILN
jgi:hypothetical protein